MDAKMYQDLVTYQAKRIEALQKEVARLESLINQTNEQHKPQTK
jgi:uncharacterized small protein (DUF1192 family)